MTSPNIFDRRTIRVNLERAAATLPQTDFLIRHAVEELLGRFATVKRTFTTGADIGSYHGVAAQMLKACNEGLTLVSFSPVLALAEKCPVPRVVANEEALPIKDGSLDFVISALSLQLVNDLPGALIQIKRALRPDGLFLAALLGGDSLIELREAFLTAEVETTGGVSPRVFPTADLRDMGSLMQRAGFALPVLDSERLTIRYADPLSLIKDLKDMGMANPLKSRSKKPLRRDTLARAAEIYATRFGSDAKVSATFEIIYLCGWSPHQSQQKPARPGSANVSLAEALRTVEISAQDKAAFRSKQSPDA